MSVVEAKRNILSLNSFIVLLLLLPSVTFNIIDSEIFPWPIIGLIALTVFRKPAVDKHLLIYFFLLVISSVFSLLMVTSSEYLSESLRSIIAFISPVFAFIIVSQTKREIVERVAFSLTCFYILMAFGQLSGLILNESIDSVLKFMIPRGSIYNISDSGGRGYRLLSSEPERASTNLFFLLLIISRGRLNLILASLFLLLNLIYFKSLAGLFLFGVWCLCSFGKKLYLAMVATFVFLRAIPLGSLQWDNRVYVLLTNVFRGDLNFSYAIDIINLSGFRLISVISSYIYALNEPFGGGIGNWRISSVESLNLLPMDIQDFSFFNENGLTNFRPFSYIAGLSLDFGIIGIFIGVFLSLIFWKSIRTLSIFPIVCLWFFGSIGDPLLFIYLGYLARSSRNG